MENALTPYARALGIDIASLDEDAPILMLDFASEVEGRPGAFHGGATAGLLESAGYALLRTRLAAQNRTPLLKPVNITVQYLSAGLSKRSYAQGRIVRLGRRNVNLGVEAWQDERSAPIATAVMNILMVDKR